MIIFTHRGLEPSKRDFYLESSYEAFENHLERGFGIEFDLNFAKDGIVVWHDSDLKQLTDGKDDRKISDLAIEEIKQISEINDKGRISTFSELLQLIVKSKAELHALHLKGSFQQKEKLDLLLNEINKYPEVIKKLLIFDLKPESAIYIKAKIPELKLAPSVAHEYDIERYNGFVHGTLIGVDDAIRYKDLYDWVWLDEWDTVDENNGEKKFYTKENFERLRERGYKISLVTPELHGTSPGLLGGEAHRDAEDKERLFERIKEIISLKPDALCTDYPEELRNLIN